MTKLNRITLQAAIYLMIITGAYHTISQMIQGHAVSTLLSLLLLITGCSAKDAYDEYLKEHQSLKNK